MVAQPSNAASIQGDARLIYDFVYDYCAIVILNLSLALRIFLFANATAARDCIDIDILNYS